MVYLEMLSACEIT